MSKNILLIWVLFIMGCSSITEWHSNDQFDEVAESYKTAIRWENIELAGQFLSLNEAEKRATEKAETQGDQTSLNEYKVTSYKELNRKLYTEKQQIDQSVEIKYYNKKNMIEKTIIDNQVWVYESEAWVLTSGLPDFK